MFRDENPSPNPPARHNEISLPEISSKPDYSYWSASLKEDMDILRRSIAICDAATRQANAALNRVIERLDEGHSLEAEIRQASHDLRNDLNNMLTAQLNHDPE